MKHTTPILTLVALAAAASAAPGTAASSALNYDRISVGYTQLDTIKGTQVGFTAGLGDHLIVGGNYLDATARNLPVSADGKATSVGLGVKFAAGPGDIILSYAYEQLQLGGAFQNGVFIGASEADVFGLNYRVALNNTVELNLGVAHSNSSGAVVGYDLTTNPITVETAPIDDSTTSYSLGIRFNITKQFDVGAGYTYSSDNDGWNISAGFSF